MRPTVSWQNGQYGTSTARSTSIFFNSAAIAGANSFSISSTGKYDLGILFGYPADPGVVVNDNCASGRIGWDAPIAQVFSRYKGLLILQP
jgi:hypothetical protein